MVVDSLGKPTPSCAWPYIANLRVSLIGAPNLSVTSSNFGRLLVKDYRNLDIARFP